MVARYETLKNKEAEYFFILRLSPESYESNLQAGLLAYPVPAAFPYRKFGTVARVCRNTQLDLQLRG